MGLREKETRRSFIHRSVALGAVVSVPTVLPARVLGRKNPRVNTRTGSENLRTNKPVQGYAAVSLSTSHPGKTRTAG